MSYYCDCITCPYADDDDWFCDECPHWHEVETEDDEDYQDVAGVGIVV